jgi:hypothetical protein
VTTQLLSELQGGEGDFAMRKVGLSEWLRRTEFRRLFFTFQLLPAMFGGESPRLENGETPDIILNTPAPW